MKHIYGIAAASCLALACKKAPESTEPDPVVAAEGYYVRGSSEYLKGDFDAALRAYDEVEKRLPKDPRLPAARGEVYLSQGRLGDALAHFQEAAQRAPERQTNWSRLGYVQKQLGQRDAARTSLEKALQMKADDWQAREQLSEVYGDAGDIAKSADALRQAVKDAPEADHVRLANHLGEKLAKNNLDEPLWAFLKEERTAGRASADLLSQAAALRLKRGELDGAAELYRAAADAAKSDAGLWELLGEVEMRRSNLDAADEAFVKGLEAQDAATLHVARVRLAMKRNNRGLASQQLELALKAATGEDPRESEELADGLLLMNRKEDALKLLANLAAEPGFTNDSPLQKRTAELAQSLKKEDIRTAACHRLSTADGGVPLKSSACK